MAKTNNNYFNYKNKNNQKPKEQKMKKMSKFKVIPLGGLGEVGKNMTLVEYEGDIIVVDCGIGFPDVVPELCGRQKPQKHQPADGHTP